MKHLIRKQLISLQLDAGQNSFLIQQQARDFYYQQITPALEKLFDELSLENEIIYIEKLEIDLGDLGWKNDRFTLDKDAIYRILIQSFGKSISKSAISLNAQEQVSYRTPEENTFQQWLYYLEKGVLPWQVHTTDAKWLHQVLHQLAIDHVSIEKTKRMMVTDPRFLTRLVREHHEKFLQHLAEVITAKRQPGLIEKVREVRKQFSEFPGETQFSEKEIWEQVLKQYAEGKSSIDFPEILPVEKKILPISTRHHDNKILQEGLYCHYAGLV
ncbi:MAG: contractile injection system tape measure protein, partial [Flavisolibacter sp.]